MTPELMPDGRYLVVDGRRWRATDPAIPESRRDELTKALMAWRREARRTRRARWSADVPVPGVSG